MMAAADGLSEECRLAMVEARFQHADNMDTLLLSAMAALSGEVSAARHSTELCTAPYQLMSVMSASLLWSAMQHVDREVPMRCWSCVHRTAMVCKSVATIQHAAMSTMQWHSTSPHALVSHCSTTFKLCARRSILNSSAEDQLRFATR